MKNIVGGFIKEYWISSLIAVLGVVLTIVSYFIPNVKINIKWLVGLFILLFSFIFAEGKLIWDLARDKRLLLVDRRPKKYHAGENALVIRRSDEISINSLVGIYEILDGDMERIIAIGEVYTQTDKISQVRILEISLKEAEAQIQPAILFSDEKLKRYIVKPHIPSEIFRNILVQGESNE